MKSFTVIAIALFALGMVSCETESVASDEALFDTNDSLIIETTANTGNTGTADDPPEDG